jgi:hypothetical protein
MTRTPADTQATLDKLNESRERTIAKLTARIAELERRDLFVVKKDFDPKKHLSAAAQVVYASQWAWIELEWEKTLGRIAAGLNPYTVTPMTNGLMHLKSWRMVQPVVQSLLFMLDHYGELKALRKLQEAWDIALNPAHMATGFLTTSTRDRTLEQPGEPRFVYHGVDGGTPLAGTWDSDTHALDWSLHTGTVGASKYAFRQNLRLGCGRSYVLVRDWSLALERRLTFLSAGVFGRKHWFTFGSTLRHAVEARFNWHYYEWLDTGSPKHWDAWQQLGKWLEADKERVTLEDGRTILIFSHTVDGYSDYQFTPKDKPSAQDSTYVRESIPNMLLSHMGGSPFHSEADQAAMARTMHLCVMSKGPKGGTIAGTIAGSGPESAKGQRVVFAQGKPYPTQRTTNTRPEVTEGVHQISYGLALTGSHLAKESPSFEQSLRDIPSTAGARAYGRYGARIGLGFYATERLAA